MDNKRQRLAKQVITREDLIHKILINFQNSGKESIIGEFCKHLCPTGPKQGEKYSWSKHCGYYAGERSCDSAENFYKEYESLIAKHRGQ